METSFAFKIAKWLQPDRRYILSHQKSFLRFQNIGKWNLKYQYLSNKSELVSGPEAKIPAVKLTPNKDIHHISENNFSTESTQNFGPQQVGLNLEHRKISKVLRK